MTPADIASLFGAMFVLALAPSVSVMLVTTKAAASGFSHGASAATGVVAGDLLFILLAVFGLGFLVDILGGNWYLLKYIAAAYLVWLGVRLWLSGARDVPAAPSQHTSLRGSFMAGLLLTLADQKAIVFYLAFLPAFLDMSEIAWTDVGILAAITLVAVGGAKLAYAYAGGRMGALVSPAIGRTLNAVAAGVMFVAALVLMLRA
jgi:threonine/homoserine/homoserine lactone efflux protein